MCKNRSRLIAALSEYSPKEQRSIYKAAWYLKQNEAKDEFTRGDRVSFPTKNGDKVFGIIARINQRTISVTEEGNKFRTWRVAPTLLEFEESA